MSLPDGRKVVRGTTKERGREDDIVVHPDFRLVLLANRPGYRKWLLLIPYIAFKKWELTFSSS